MKKALLMAVLVAFAASTSFAATAAKAAPAKSLEIGVGAGLALPMGDFGDAAGMGFGGGVAVRKLMNPKMGIGLQLSYYTFGKKEDFMPTFSMIEILASAKIKMGTSSAKPYFLANVGLCNFASGDMTITVPFLGEITVEGGSSTEIEIQPGLGVEFGSKTKMFVEGKLGVVLTEGSTTMYIPVNVGVLF